MAVCGIDKKYKTENTINEHNNIDVNHFIFYDLICCGVYRPRAERRGDDLNERKGPRESALLFILHS